MLGGDAADTIDGGRDDDFLTGNDGGDVFVFRASNAGTGVDLITDFDTTEDVVELVGFDAGFDPLEALSAHRLGTILDLGDGNEILFAGRLVAEFTADDFRIV